jgi:hypothetical protein
MDIYEEIFTYFWLIAYFIILIGFLIGLLLAFLSIKRGRSEKLHQYDLTFLEIKLPRDNEVEIEAAEHLFSNLAGLKKSFFKRLFTGRYRVSFEIVSKSEGINFYVVVPDEIASFVEKQINGVYQDAEIDIINPNEVWDRGKFTKVARLALKGAVYSPLKTYEEIKTDPLNPITSAMSKLNENEVLAVQYLVSPAGESWRRSGRKFINNVRAKLSDPEKHYQINEDYLETIEEKLSLPAFDTDIRLVSISENKNTAQMQIDNLAKAFDQFSDVNHGRFVLKKPLLGFGSSGIAEQFIFRKIHPREITLPLLDVNFYKNVAVLTTKELATIFHFPNKEVQTPNISWLTSRRSSAPTNLPKKEEGIWIGESSFRGVQKQIFVKKQDRTRHFYIVGQTGTGKSELLKYMALQDIQNGEGVAIIDPHGTDVEDLLSKIPPHRVEDVIYFNASDTQRPMGLNLLECENEEEQHMIINSFIALLYKLYDPNRQGIMGPKLERAIRNVMLTAMIDKNSTLVDVLRLLIDPGYAKKFIPQIKDPLVKKYWTDEVAQTSDFHKSETMGYFVSKFDKFVTDKLMRNILGQPKSAFVLPKVMAEKKILLVDLAKGKIGEENSNFLGLILVPKILSSALARHRLLEQGEDFPDFYLYVDEFQNFATPDFKTILSEARKYKLNLIVAHQFIEQLSEEIKNAIFGNVGSMCVFRTGAEDAEFLEHYLAPTFTQKDISNLPVGNSYVKLLVDGQPTAPFSMHVPWEVIHTKVLPNQATANKIKEISSLKYGVPVSEVEEYINYRAGFNEKTSNAKSPF